MEKCICLIPARGGSKGVPKKNIKELHGKPLIAYTIEAAFASQVFDHVYVSTDNEEIAAVAQQYGATIPFMRPAHLAADDTTDLPVLQHFIAWYSENIGELSGKLLAYLRPTSPNRKATTISRCVQKLLESPHLDAIRSVTAAEGVHHPYWMYTAEGDTLAPFSDKGSPVEYPRRQLLPKCYRLNGTVDITRVSNLLNNSLYGEKIGYEVLEEIEAMDIDTEFDFLLVETVMGRVDSLGGRGK